MTDETAPTRPVAPTLGYRARLLDPVTALRSPGHRLKPTAYVGNRLLIRPGAGTTEQEWLPLLQAAAAVHQMTASAEAPHPHLAELVERAGLTGQALPFAVRVTLRPADRGTLVEKRKPKSAKRLARRQAREMADAWRVLREFERDLNARREHVDLVQLDHLLTATLSGVHGAPYVSATGAPYVSAMGAPYVSATGSPYVSATGAPYVSATGAPYVSATGAPYVSAMGAPYVSATGSPYVSAFGSPYVSGTGAPYVSGVGAPYVSSFGAPYVSGGGTPYVSGPYSGGSPADEYTYPGFGGRVPVAWVGESPARRRDGEVSGRRPVVAVLDTGCGRHAWWDPDRTEDNRSLVDRAPAVRSVRDGERALVLPIGLADPDDAASRNDTANLLDDDQLDSDAGHGTFIAGIIHQTCPDADILSVRVMSSDGYVAEADLLEALNLIWLRQVLAIKEKRHADLVDVICLSLGYYHEEVADPEFDSILLDTLRRLGALGVVVVTAAGNDSTAEPYFPAAFSPHRGGPVATPDHDVVPVVSVGARNPNGTIALFSNGGDWVSCYRSGAAVVSTFPTTFNGPRSPSVRMAMGNRETLDPDDFKGGFGVWSGTSFAAPLLAGEIARRLLDDIVPDTAQAAYDEPAAVERGWAAVTDAMGMRRPRLKP